MEWQTQRTIRSANHLTELKYDSFTLAPTGAKAERAVHFHHGLQLVFDHGGWTVVLDEIFYLNRLSVMENKKRVSLEADIEDLYTQGRSKHVTVVGGLQRPVAVTRFALSQSRHVLAFAMEDRDAKELGYATSQRVEAAVQTLQEYEFVWFHRPRRLWVGKLNLKTGTLEGRYL